MGQTQYLHSSASVLNQVEKGLTMGQTRYLTVFGKYYGQSSLLHDMQVRIETPFVL